MSHAILIGIGSNLKQPIKQVQAAIESLKNIPGTVLIRTSSLYSSSPQGPQDQDNYVNAAALLETSLSPTELLQSTQSIEQQFGRVKTRHWGERIIDLDILFYDQQEISLQDPDLCIPHREALTRDFVLIPCLEIAEDWKLPDGKSLNAYRDSCLSHSLHKLNTQT